MENLTLAGKLNKALSEGKILMACQYASAVQFNPSWAGKLQDGKNGDIIVKQGKKTVCYSHMGTDWKVYTKAKK